MPSIAGTASAPPSASRGITVATGVIADWRANGAIAPRYKAVAVAIMLASFSASMAMGIASLEMIIQGAAPFILSRPNDSG